MDDRYIIDTPENIEFGYDVAGIGSRMVAAIVDTFLIVIVQAIVLFAAGLATASLGIAENILAALGIIIGFLLLWGYYIAFEVWWNGQSPGKRLCGLRVVREGGRPITFTASVIRNLVRLVDFLPILYGIGVVAMFIDTRSRRLGDLAAGVLVVRERSEVTLASLVAGTGIIPTAMAAMPSEPVQHIEILREADYRIAQEFLDQRTRLSREVRLRLASEIGQRIAERLGITPDLAAEPFLERVVQSYRAHLADLAQPAAAAEDA